MVSPNAFVDGVSGLSATPETLAARPDKPRPEFVTVSFQGGRSGLLDSTNPRSAVWADVLDSQRQANLPVYVEIDPETRVITELLCPLTVNVGDIIPTAEGEDVVIELIISHARHYLRSKHPDFKELLKTLKTAQEKKTKVIVTESDDNEIIDVRPVGELEAGRAE
jgi:hypothetical protein